MQGWKAGFMPEARGMRPSFGQPGATQLNQSIIPPECCSQVTSTPAIGRGTRQMLKLQHYSGMDSLDTFLRKFHSMSRRRGTYSGTKRTRCTISVDAWRELQIRSCVTSGQARHRLTSSSSHRRNLVQNYNRSGSKQSCVRDDDVPTRRSRTSTETSAG